MRERRKIQEIEIKSVENIEKNRVNYYNNIKVLANKNLDSKRGLRRILH